MSNGDDIKPAKNGFTLCEHKGLKVLEMFAGCYYINALDVETLLRAQFEALKKETQDQPSLTKEQNGLTYKED